MANTFKARHLTSVSNSSAETIISSSDTNNKQVIVVGLQLSNTGSSEIKGTVTLNNSADTDTGDLVLINQVAIPANSLVSVFVGDKVVLETGDSLKIQSDTASALNAVASYLEITS